MSLSTLTRNRAETCTQGAANPLLQATATLPAGGNNGASPVMHAKGQAARPADQGFGLPHELQTLLLNWVAGSSTPIQSAQSVRNMGLSCQHWSLRVRDYFDGTQGKALRRDVEVQHFVEVNGQAPEQVFRRLMERGAITAFVDEANTKGLKHCATQLKSNPRPVYLDLGAGVKWLTEPMQAALASRKAKLTVLDFEGVRKDDIGGIAAAIRQVPRGGYVALKIDSSELSALDAAALCKAIADHPVVCHLGLSARNDSGNSEQVASWLACIAKEETGIRGLAFESCKLTEQSSEQLDAMISALPAGVRMLSVDEDRASVQDACKLFDAVRAMKADRRQALYLDFGASNLGQADFRDAGHASLESEGIHIRPSVEESFKQEMKDMLTEHADDDSALGSDTDDDSNEYVIYLDNSEESSEVVGDPSSADNEHDSEFSTTSESASGFESSDDASADDEH